MREKWYILLLASILSLPGVLAAAPAPIDMIKGLFENNLKWLFVDFTSYANSAFWLRFLVWVLLFSAYYAILIGVVPPFRSRKNTTVIISLVLSIISAIFIPDGILISIGKSYGFSASFLLMAVPIGGMIFLMVTAFPTGRTDKAGNPRAISTRRINHIVKAIIYYLIYTLIGNYIDAIANDPVFTRGGDVIAWGGMMESIVILLFVYHLLAALFISGPVREGGERVWNFFRNLFRGRTPPPAEGIPPPGGGGERPPGIEPPATPPNRNPTDPPTNPESVPPGLNPSGPRPSIPPEPRKPFIPDDKQIFVDLSPEFNGIRSQDSLGACTAFAATSIFEYILHVGYNLPKNYLSPLFLWYKTRETLGKINEDTGPATSLIPMTNLLKDGVCFENLWDFEDSRTDKWKTTPDIQAQNDAATKRIMGVHALDKNDPDQWVYQLLEKNPINIAISVPADWGRSRKLYDNFNPSPIRGGHAMVIVGYHSHYPYNGKGIKAFKIRNSWDTTWGENGYIWVPAETLKKMLLEDPLIISGWNKKEGAVSKHFRITGRAVFDFGKQRIDNSRTGAQIFNDNNLPCPDDHRFFVGAMAQIKGEIKIIANESVNPGNRARFSLEFDEDLSQFEQLTSLPRAFPEHFSEINFKNMPAGVVVFKTEKGENGKDILWFHIVQFHDSLGGRGGEGIRDNNTNRSSIVYNPKIKNSGIPITFSSSHTHEMNVIIPVVAFSWLSQKDKENEFKLQIATEQNK